MDSNVSSPDVVFIVKERVRRPELQYALRSWSLVPHGTVWFIGGLPQWVRNVEHVPFGDGRNKWKNISDKFRLIPTVEGIAERFYYTEDDYFIVKPFDEIPHMVKPGTFESARSKGSSWHRYLNNTEKALIEAGIENPRSYDVHIPLLVEKSRIPLEFDSGRPISWRSMWGNVSDYPYETTDVDVKQKNEVRKAKLERRDLGFLSSSDSTFDRFVLPTLKKLFPDPSPYERD